MPTNDTSTYNSNNEFLDTGISGIPPINAVIPDPSLTGNQNFSSDKFFGDMNANLLNDNSWLKTSQFGTPINTRLKDTLRYNDPTYGYDAYNPNLEYQYGDRQGFLDKWKNNLLKFGATAIGGTLEGLATLPLVVDAIAEGKLSNIENNSLTNSLVAWQDRLENDLPNYQTTTERDHPFLNYIPIYGNTGDSWGGVLKSLGYTVGAIAGSLLTDTAIGSVTGGIGEVPLLATQYTKIAGKLGKIFGASDEVFNGYKAAKAAGQDIVKSIDGISNTAKIIDKARYNLSLLTSATAEGMIEANQSMNITRDQLKKDYYDTHGHDATGDEAIKIENDSLSSGNATLLANIALLTLTNSIQFESLLKPTALAKQGINAGIDSDIALRLKEGSLDLLEELPDVRKGFKGILKKVGGSRLAESFGTEGFEEGAQFVIQNTSQDYYKRKYDQPSIDAVDNFTSSIGTGLHDVFTTREGLENILIGGLSGAIIHPVRSLIEKQLGINNTRQQRLAETLDVLNAHPITGLFNDKYNGAVNAYNIQNEMSSQLKGGDLYGYRNAKFSQLFNFVDAGIKTNRFDTQISRLNDLKQLDEKDLRGILNIDDPNVTKQELDTHIDSVIAKSYEIKQDIDKVNSAFKNPYNSYKQKESYNIYDTFKTQLSVSLSQLRDNKSRIESIGQEITTAIPNANIDKIVNLTSDKGIKQTVTDFKARLKELNTDEELFKGDTKKSTEIQKEKSFLEDQISSLNNFTDATFNTSNNEAQISAINDIMNYYSNNGLQSNNNDVDLIDAISNFNKAQDISKLYADISDLKQNYKTLLDPKGFQSLANSIKALEAQRTVVATPLSDNTIVPDDLTEEIDDKGNPIISEQPIVTDSIEEAEVVDNEPNPEDAPFDPDIIDKEIAENKTKSKSVGKEDKNNKVNFNKVIQDINKVVGVPEVKITTSVKPAEPVIQKSSLGQRKYNFNPLKYFSSLFTRDRADNGNEATNLREAVLNKDKNIIYNSLTLSVAESAQGKKYGEYDKFQAYPNIYYTGYKNDIAVNIDGNVVGKIQPADRLAFSKDGKFTPLSSITLEDYENVTGNSPDTYNDFIQDIKAHDEIVKNIETQFKGGKTTFTNEEVKSLFNIGISYGYIDYADSAAASTPLSKITYESNGNVVLSLSIDSITNERVSKPRIIGREKITEENHQKLLNYISENIDRLKNLDSRYIFVAQLPNGEYDSTSGIAARPLVVDEESIKQLYSILTTKADSNEEISKINQKLRESYYISDSRNVKGKGTKMYFSIEKGGLMLYLNIYNGKITYVKNGETKHIFRERVKIPNPAKFKSLEELLGYVNVVIRQSEVSNKGLSLLGINIAKSDIKTGILNDEEATFESLKDSLSVAVRAKPDGTSGIFDHPNINILPLNTKQRTIKQAQVQVQTSTAAPIETPVQVEQQAKNKQLESDELSFLNLVKKSDKIKGIYEVTYNAKTFTSSTKPGLKSAINDYYNALRNEAGTTIKKEITVKTPVETKTSTVTSESFIKDKEAKQKARDEAKSQTKEQVDNEFLNSLGC